MKKIFYLLFICVLVVSCKTIRINKQSQKIAASKVELGTIGLINSNLEINALRTVGIPKYQEKIRLKVAILPHNKSTFKALKKSSKLQGENILVDFNDSIVNKPKYMTLQLADFISTIDQLNSKENISIIEYLKVSQKSKMVTTISIVFNKELFNSFENAEEVYLVNSKYKKYEFELYKNNKLIKVITLDKHIVFAYKLSSFCWKENDRGMIVLANIVNKASRCKENTFKSFQKAFIKQEKIKF